MSRLLLLLALLGAAPLQAQDPLLARADSFLIAKDYARALPLYQAAVQADPNSERAQFGLGVSYAGLNRYHDALPPMTEAVRMSPADTYDLVMLGAIYIGVEQYHDAVAPLLKAIAIDPGHKVAHFQLGIAYSKLGRRDEALQQYAWLQRADSARAARLLAIINLPNQPAPAAASSATAPPATSAPSPGAADELLKQADNLAAAKEYAKALDGYQKVAALKPDADRLSRALAGVGMCNYRLGRYAEARKALEAQARLMPGDPWILYWIGDTYRQQNMSREADSAWSAVLARHPTDPGLLLGLGEGLYEVGDYNTAKAVYQQVLTLKADPLILARAHAGLGMYQSIFEKDHAKAIANYQEAVRLDPANADVLWGLGAAYARAGDKADAMTVYRKLQPMNPKLAEALLDRANRAQ